MTMPSTKCWRVDEPSPPEVWFVLYPPLANSACELVLPLETVQTFDEIEVYGKRTRIDDLSQEEGNRFLSVSAASHAMPTDKLPLQDRMVKVRTRHPETLKTLLCLRLLNTHVPSWGSWDEEQVQRAVPDHIFYGVEDNTWWTANDLELSQDHDVPVELRVLKHIIYKSVNTDKHLFVRCKVSQHESKKDAEERSWFEDGEHVAQYGSPNELAATISEPRRSSLWKG